MTTSDEIRRALAFLHSADSTFELCGIGPEVKKHRLWGDDYAGGKKPIVAGWFSDQGKAAEVATALDAEARPEGIYVTLNPTRAALLGRADHRLKAGVGRTQDAEVEYLINLLVDGDPVRPAGISATEAEKVQARKMSRAIYAFLRKCGWPDPLCADSGNGDHLVYKIDLPNTPENVALVKKVLQALAARFDTDDVKVDQSVFNPARLVKLWGTMARKGDDTADRPHRRSTILHASTDARPVPRELLETLAAEVEDATPPAREPRENRFTGDGQKLDVVAYCRKYGVTIKGEKQHGTSTLYVIDPCVFNPEHSGGEAAIGQCTDGKLFYQCYHNSCQGRTWAEARQVISGDDPLFEMPKQHRPRRSQQAANNEAEKAAAHIVLARLVVTSYGLGNIRYPRHVEFMRLGATHATRCFMAANRVGKTKTGSYEVACHATGLYPDWWEGRRFDRATEIWVAGDTKETVRDIIQRELVGAQGQEGTGMIPGDELQKVAYRPNGNGAVDYALVKHVSGGTSRIGFKSYDQKRESFQGTAKDLIWLDEESDEGIRAECVMRLMTTNGLLMETFTPLKGLTPIVLTYLGDSQPSETRTALTDDRAMIMAGWDDAPHLSDAQKARMLAECEPHLKDARSKGIPSLGSGAIYPIAEEDITVADFTIPDHWPRVYALDVGWRNTAALWAAWDREADVVYLTAEYKRGQCEPAIHAQAVKTRGEWIPGVVDPASAGAGQKDGEKLMDVYRGLGLDIQPADNAVEAGLLAVWERMSSGRLKVFKSLQAWLAEYRIYRRDEKGRIVKDNDHLMDDTRYLIMSGLQIARTKPVSRSKAHRTPWRHA